MLRASKLNEHDGNCRPGGVSCSVVYCFFPLQFKQLYSFLLASPGLKQLSRPQGNSDSLGLLGSVVRSHLQQLFLTPEVTSGGTLTKLWSGSGSLIPKLLPGPAVVSTSTLGHPGRMLSL